MRDTGIRLSSGAKRIDACPATPSCLAPSPDPELSQRRLSVVKKYLDWTEPQGAVENGGNRFRVEVRSLYTTSSGVTGGMRAVSVGLTIQTYERHATVAKWSEGWTFTITSGEFKFTWP